MTKTVAWRHGLKAPCVDLQIDLDIPEDLDIQALDRFLLEELRVPPEDIEGIVTEDAGRAKPARYVARLLWVQSALLRIGLLPCFEPGWVLSLLQLGSSGRRWRAVVALPFVDEIPVEHLQNALKTANGLARAIAMAGASVRVDRAKVGQVIEQSIIRPLRGVSGGGVSTLPILRAAHSLGIPIRHLGSGSYRLGWGANSRLFSRSSIEADSAIGAELSSRKDLTARMLAAAGVPCPVHRLVHTLEAARKAVAELGVPVVVKPVDRERSEGVTTRIGDDAALERAFDFARKFSEHLLVERQIDGMCYRLMVANGRFLYAVERGARAVTGDGRNDIAQLLAADATLQRSAPLSMRKKVVEPDAETLALIASQGYDLRSVPKAGAVVRLRAIESVEWGEMTIDVTDKVHPANIEIAERAARALRLCNAGIDLMTTDISRAWSETGGVVTEVNFRPHFGASTAARARMDAYLDSVIPDRGRIPIEVFVGWEEARAAARARLRQWSGRGKHALLCGSSSMEGPDGEIGIALDDRDPRQRGLYGRCRVALQDPRTEVLIAVVEDTALLTSGLPFDRITELEVIADLSNRKEGQTANHRGSESMLALVNVLKRYKAVGERV